MANQIEENLKNKNLEILGPVGIDIRRSMEEEFDYLVSNSDPRKLPSAVMAIKKYEMNYDVIIQLSHLMIATGVNEGQNYVQLAMAIGDRVRNYYKCPRQNNNSLNLGAFILNAYTVQGLIITKLINSHEFNKVKPVYKVYASDRAKLRKLKVEFNELSDPYKPLLQQAPDWKSGSIKNDIGEEIKLVKNSDVSVTSQINENNTPVVLNAINKKQKIAYYVKPEIFEVYQWALKTNQPCFEHNSVDTIELDRKAAKKREAEAILEATEPYVGKIFYQQYTADNRGRLYPLSAYLNELNSDNAKGMLSFAEGKPLGTTGLAQLKHHIANMYGEDKLTHEGRVKFVDDNYESFTNYGLAPKAYKGWMDAAEPFQFLNAVMDLYNFDIHIKNGGKEEDYISTTICYRDGSNNGLQWLFSLAKDDKHAHLANVKRTPDDKPGDMYTHVAKAVIQQIAEKVGEEQSVALENYELFFKTIERLRNRCRETELKYGMKDPISERKRKLVKWYQKRYKAELKSTDLLYWDKAKDNGFDTKTWRKVVKRNVMTYGYSATKQGMGEQIIQDTRDINNVYLSNKQHSAARLLGSMVYSTIENEFPLVSATMKLFKDNCGEYMKQTGKQYKHTTPISNFPFVQKYVKYKMVRGWVQRVLVQNDDKTNEYKTLEFRIQAEQAEPNIAKAKAGISPNTIHNLDSLHLMLVLDECNFDIVSAHDSYGSHACNIVEMQKVIREQFKRIIDLDPIQDILNQTGNLIPKMETGNLNSSEILDAEFAFS